MAFALRKDAILAQSAMTASHGDFQAPLKYACKGAENPRFSRFHTASTKSCARTDGELPCRRPCHNARSTGGAIRHRGQVVRAGAPGSPGCGSCLLGRICAGSFRTDRSKGWHTPDSLCPWSCRSCWRVPPHRSKVSSGWAARSASGVNRRGVESPVLRVESPGKGERGAGFIVANFGKAHRKGF